MREVERQVMLRIIDQRWREHLEEMDYLKEGINLRAMGQKDPLTEWQREGFEMFGAMMKGIAQDFVRYVMHVQVVRNEPAAGGRRAERHQTSRDDEPTGCQRAAAVQSRPPRRSTPAPAAPTARRPAPHGDAPDGGASPARRRRRRGRSAAPSRRPVVKDEWSKTPRNAPCPCGVGKKFKMCHGAGA